MKTTLAATALSLLLAGSLALGQDKGAGTAAKGKEVFESNCSVCHNADSTETKVGPGLKGLFKKAALINKGSDSGMPPYADMLTAAEKADVIAYLKTL